MDNEFHIKVFIVNEGEFVLFILISECFDRFEEARRKLKWQCQKSKRKREYMYSRAGFRGL